MGSLQTSIVTDGFRSLAEGEQVEFYVEQGDDGRTKAVQVSGPAGQPPRVRVPVMCCPAPASQESSVACLWVCGSGLFRSWGLESLVLGHERCGLGVFAGHWVVFCSLLQAPTTFSWLSLPGPSWGLSESRFWVLTLGPVCSRRAAHEINCCSFSLTPNLDEWVSCSN